jgi:hypothetical protein
VNELVKGLEWLGMLVPAILGLVKAKRDKDPKAALEALLALERQVEDQIAREEIGGP